MEGNPLAQCPLKEITDTKNYLYLTEKQLVVKINNRFFTYELETLQSLNWTHKKLLLPIISGGLITSLSAIAYINGLLHPWLLLLLFICGVLLFYYGFSGTPALNINFKNSNKEYYLLKNTSIYLDKFIQFVNHYLFKKNVPEYFFKISKTEWANALKIGYISSDKPFQLLEDLPSEANKEIILKLVIKDNAIKISYLPTENNNELKPYVTEHIPLKAVSEA